jgi:hypothetical protein
MSTSLTPRDSNQPCMSLVEGATLLQSQPNMCCRWPASHESDLCNSFLPQSTATRRPLSCRPSTTRATSPTRCRPPATLTRRSVATATASSKHRVCADRCVVHTAIASPSFQSWA